jgi:hypothetical protein
MFKKKYPPIEVGISPKILSLEGFSGDAGDETGSSSVKND